MSTTLEQELLRAAERAAIRAQEIEERTDGVRWRHLRGIHEAEALSLRARAAWVRELERDANELRVAGKVNPRSAWQMLRRLTGPIPAAETAPSERKEP